MNSKESRAILIGSRGLLGSALLPALHREFSSVTCLNRAELNLTDLGLMERVLDALEFDVVINAAGHTAVDDCEVEERLARLVNAEAPAKMAEIACAKGARMVHFSTDYVFDGEKGIPYREEDEAVPISAYGRTKLEGEQGVLDQGDAHLVLRLSWLFGQGRAAFPRWVLRTARTEGRVRIVADKLASPTCARDVAKWLVTLLGKEASGIYHLCNGGVCSWKEWGELVIQSAVAKGLLTESTVVEPIQLSDLTGLTAKRPLYSALDTGKFSDLTGITPRSWQQATQEHVSALKEIQ